MVRFVLVAILALVAFAAVLPWRRGLVTEKNKLLAGTLMLLATSSLYAFTNRWHATTPVALAPTWIDRTLPAVPWTVWIYATYPLATLALFIERDPRRIERWLRATLAVNAFSNAVFLAWPTTIDRGAVLAAPAGPWTHAAIVRLQALDAAANGLPSLHVSTAFLAALLFNGRRPVLCLAGVVWASAVAVSTITTRQHHSLDVVSGVALALVAHAIFLSGTRPEGASAARLGVCRA